MQVRMQEDQLLSQLRSAHVAIMVHPPKREHKQRRIYNRTDEKWHLLNKHNMSCTILRIFTYSLGFHMHGFIETLQGKNYAIHVSQGETLRLSFTIPELYCRYVDGPELELSIFSFRACVIHILLCMGTWQVINIDIIVYTHLTVLLTFKVIIVISTLSEFYCILDTSSLLCFIRKYFRLGNNISILREVEGIENRKGNKSVLQHLRLADFPELSNYTARKFYSLPFPFLFLTFYILQPHLFSLLFVITLCPCAKVK